MDATQYDLTPAAWAGLSEELRALALVSLGITEFWAARFEEAERHLDEGVTLARRIGRPFLEFSGLVYQAGIELFRSFTRAAERSRQAIELAEPDGRLLWFMLYPAPDLLERRARQRTAHAALIAQILDLLAGPGGYGGTGSSPRLAEPLSRSELRVLRYLPTQPVGTGDRRRAVRLAEHRQDPHAQPVRQARRAQPGRGRQASPCSGPARTVRAPLSWLKILRIVGGGFIRPSMRLDTCHPER